MWLLSQLEQPGFQFTRPMWPPTNESTAMDLSVEQANEFLDKLNQLYLSANGFEAYLDENTGRILYRKWVLVLVEGFIEKF